MLTTGTVSFGWSFSDDPHRSIPVTCHVFSKCTYDLILGRGFLTATEILTKFKHRLQQCAFRVSSLLHFGFAGSNSQRLRGSLNGNLSVLALADSGAERNVMDFDFALAHGLDIDDAPECRGYLQFADGSIQRTTGQARVSWTFENGETTLETFEVLENCIVDVVLGEDVLYRHDIFDMHRSSLVFSEACGEHIELAPFDYSRKLKILRKIGRSSQEDPNQLPDAVPFAVQEKERQAQWNYEFDFGNKATPAEQQAEDDRRQQFNTRHPGLLSTGPTGRTMYIQATDHSDQQPRRAQRRTIRDLLPSKVGFSPFKFRRRSGPPRATNHDR